MCSAQLHVLCIAGAFVNNECVCLLLRWISHAVESGQAEVVPSLFFVNLECQGRGYSCNFSVVMMEGGRSDYCIWN